MGTQKFVFFCISFWCVLAVAPSRALPANLLYEYNVPEAEYLPRGDDVSSKEINLKVPIVYFETAFDSIFVNANGLLSFETNIPNFLNIEFPLDYPIIAPFYSNVDTTTSGNITYYETESAGALQRASENVHDYFINHPGFQATSLFIVTWENVGYHSRKSDKVNTYQVAIATDGADTFVELLYPEDGLQWIQGTGDETGLPDARAQAGFISPEGKVFALPASGTEQVKYLSQWSNINLSGQWLYKVDAYTIGLPDQETPISREARTCAEKPTSCHAHAKCVDYTEGFCCECRKQFYGNGKFCISKEAPIRVNGKITGVINGEKLGYLDLQSYVVMADARAYTAISRIPESIGYDIQSLQVLGSVIGYLFAKPVRNSVNLFQLTGGVFNHTATLNFLNTSQILQVSQKYIGLDVFDQLKLEGIVQGEIPSLPPDGQITVDEYQEQYRVTSPGVIQMSSNRVYKYINESTNQEEAYVYAIDQTFTFDECKNGNSTVGTTWKLKVGKNFIAYEGKEQIIRFGLSNKISPLGDFDPCEEGRLQCGANSVCVVENDAFNCVCQLGFQFYYTENSTYCADSDECQTDLHDCDRNAQCINKIGGYECQCNPGFDGNGRVCVNSASCQNVRCSENAECYEANNIALCRCQPGFTGDGQTCFPIINHSCHLANNCSPYGICNIDEKTNNYHCSCMPGFEGDGYTCVLIETTTAPVEITTTDRVPQTCIDDICACPDGFVLNPDTLYCVRISEIKPNGTTPDNGSCNGNNCHPYAECRYSTITESHGCVCRDGFEGDGFNCAREKLSCAVENNCGADASCVYDDTIGRSACKCNPGFEGDGYSCVQSVCFSNNECALNEECVPASNQRYECACKQGYERDSQNQCVIVGHYCGGGTCAENAVCSYDDQYRTYYCDCKPGFVGDGITECKPKPSSCNELNNCGLNAECVYDTQQLNYVCRCSPGYYGDGLACYPENNCQTDPTLCDSHASCVSDRERGVACQCNSGYAGNGTICTKNQNHEGNFLLLNQGMATLKIPFEQNLHNLGKAIQVKPNQVAVGLDIDCVDGRVFWSDITNKVIRSANYNGSEKEDFITQGIGSPEGIAIDWISRNVYWTDSTKDTIDVANIETKRRRTLINVDLVNPRGIAIHPQRGKIFWTDWDRKHPKIEWANADGSGRQIFLDGPAVSLPNSLAIDYDTDQLCYADAGTKKVECIQIDSKILTTIAVNCTYPFGVAITDRQIYWTDWILKEVARVDKYSLTRLPPLKLPFGGTGRVYGIVAVPNACPPLVSVCQNFKETCPPEHICLPNGYGGRTCACAYKSNSPLEKPNCIL